MMSSAARSACLVTSCSETSCDWRSRASLTIRSASRLASASISWRSLTIQRACLISSGIVARIWSRMSYISSLSTRTWSVSGTCLALWTRSSSLSMRTRTSMRLLARSSSAGERFLQAPRDRVGDEVGDVSPEGRDLLDSARGQETVLRRGHQVDRLDVTGQMTVELVHLQLVLEVRDRAQSLDDRAGPHPARVLGYQDVEGVDADVGQVARRLLDE